MLAQCLSQFIFSFCHLDYSYCFPFKLQRSRGIWSRRVALRHSQSKNILSILLRHDLKEKVLYIKLWSIVLNSMQNISRFNTKLLLKSIKLVIVNQTYQTNKMHLSNIKSIGIRYNIIFTFCYLNTLLYIIYIFIKILIKISETEISCPIQRSRFKHRQPNDWQSLFKSSRDNEF